MTDGTPSDPKPQRASTPESEVRLFAQPEPSEDLLDDDKPLPRPSLTHIEAPEEDSDLPLAQKLKQSVMVNAVAALTKLDPVEQESATVDPYSGERLLPGLVPLAPLTFLAFLCNSTALLGAFVYSTRGNPHYLFPFAIAHSILMVHLYFYHLNYYTRRRFRVFRQVSFIAIFESFLCFMLYDMSLDPNAKNLDWLWVAFGGNAGTLIIVLAHYIVLGRGFRRVATSGPSESSSS